jgi:hypothetical protein
VYHNITATPTIPLELFVGWFTLTNSILPTGVIPPAASYSYSEIFTQFLYTCVCVRLTLLRANDPENDTLLYDKVTLLLAAP